MRFVTLIKHALSGSSLYSQWNPGQDNMDENNFGPEYRIFLETVREGLQGLRSLGYEPILRAIAWQQGEADARDIAGMEHSLAYGQNLRHFFLRIREQFEAPDMLFVYGYVIPVPLERFTGREEVRTAQQRTSGPDIPCRSRVLLWWRPMICPCAVKNPTPPTPLTASISTPTASLNWETCMTIARQWAWKPDDEVKSLEQCLHGLIRSAGGDGNLLFNVGPRPDGTIEPLQAQRLL
jgi:alpha-L-fucosidase